MKQCSYCKQLKPVECFGKDRRNNDGLQSQCKECMKRYRKQSEANRDPIRKKEYAKKYRDSHRDIETARFRRYKETNPDKIKTAKAKYREKVKASIPMPTAEELAAIAEKKLARQAEQKEKNRLAAQARYIREFISVEKVCKYCGKPFTTQYKKSKVFCCDDCQAKHSHYMSKLAEKRRKGKITASDRLDNDITLPLLFKRDKGVCQICGNMCAWGDMRYDKNTMIVGSTYPSIDHIKPVSKGGSHTWDNVQLACKLCNSIKSDKET